MKIKLCYNLEKIKQVLEENGYYFVKLPVTKSSEDWDYDTMGYYFAKPEVASVDYSYWLWTTAVVTMQDGSVQKMYGSNIESKDEDLLRIDNNDFISPILSVNDIWIESNEHVTSWLIGHGVSMELLESNRREFAVYETIEYVGVTTPSKFRDYWSYSSETLVLDEREIKTALNSIDDELLRKKIECILYARIFKRHQ